MNRLLICGIAAAALFAGCEEENGATHEPADRANQADRSPPPAPDNTARNERDAEGTTPTPIDQGNNQRDIDITAEIRRAITADSNMSVNARNVKIITNGGAVTLRGVVESHDEKDAIDRLARSIAGVTSVDNQLEVNVP